MGFSTTTIVTSSTIYKKSLRADRAIFLEMAEQVTNLKRNQEGECKQITTHHPFQDQC